MSGAKDGTASEALWLSPVPEMAGLCIPHRHPCSLPSAESRSQGSRRGLRHKPLGPGGPLCSHQEGGRLSGAEDGAASEALWLLPGRWPVVWSRRWRHLRSSLALACPRNGWPLYSTPSPGVPEPRRVPPGPEAQTSQAGGPLCTHQEGGRLPGAEDGAASEALWHSPVPETAGLCIPHRH